MPRAYSQDLRARVLAAAHAGATHLTVAARYAVGESTVRSWLRRERRTGSTTARPYRGSTGRSSLAAAGEALLVGLYAADNARTLGCDPTVGPPGRSRGFRISACAGDGTNPPYPHLRPVRNGSSAPSEMAKVELSCCDGRRYFSN